MSHMDVNGPIMYSPPCSLSTNLHSAELMNSSVLIKRSLYGCVNTVVQEESYRQEISGFWAVLV